VPVRVAEYCGQSVHSQGVIVPYRTGDQIPDCPFTHQPCIKLAKKTNATQPVCCIEAGGRLFPVCENRVLPSLKANLSPRHRSHLFNVSRILFPDSNNKLFRYGLQQTIVLGQRDNGGKDQVRIDYVLRTEDPSFDGVRAAVLEVQAGGETSSTNALTMHVQAWAESEDPSNDLLQALVKKPNPIPNNAWKRTLEQIFRKAPLCMRFGGGFAVALGTVNFNYFRRFIRGGAGYYPTWEVALIEMADNWSASPQDISFSPQQAFFMSYDEFVESVKHYPYSEAVRNPFLAKNSQLS
jgi:hypothetical protein